MKKNNKVIPKIDLSKFNNSERIDSSIEQIILNGLIAFNCDVKKVSKHFNLSEDIINMVYIKYYTQLCKIIKINNNNVEADSTISTILDLYKQHVEEVKVIVDANKTTKLLSDKITRNLNSIADRVCSIKENENRTYDNVVNTLSNQVIKQKQLEVIESGKIEDNTDYVENQESVLDKLNQFNTPMLTNPGKRIKLTDEKGNVLIYKSIQDCQKAHQDWNYKNLCKALEGFKGHGFYKGYKVDYVDEE